MGAVHVRKALYSERELGANGSLCVDFDRKQAGRSALCQPSVSIDWSCERLWAGRRRWSDVALTARRPGLHDGAAGGTASSRSSSRQRLERHHTKIGRSLLRQSENRSRRGSCGVRPPGRAAGSVAPGHSSARGQERDISASVHMCCKAC